MTRIDLSAYAPIISDKNVGEEIYDKIKDAQPRTNSIEISMQGVISMTTYCAKQIFGRLYNQLGAKLFEQNINFDGVSEDLMLIIKMGIRNAMAERYS
jgi:hypothetical protein